MVRSLFNKNTLFDHLSIKTFSQPFIRDYAYMEVTKSMMTVCVS
jgi:hypothetical protein